MLGQVHQDGLSVSSLILPSTCLTFCSLVAKLQQAILEEAKCLRESAEDVDEAIGAVEEFLQRLRLLFVEVGTLYSHFPHPS